MLQRPPCPARQLTCTTTSPGNMMRTGTGPYCEAAVCWRCSLTARVSRGPFSAAVVRMWAAVTRARSSAVNSKKSSGTSRAAGLPGQQGAQQCGAGSRRGLGDSAAPELCGLLLLELGPGEDLVRPLGGRCGSLSLGPGLGRLCLDWLWRARCRGGWARRGCHSCCC